MTIRTTILLAGLVVLGGCDSQKASAPTGQVVATVDGQEVTIAELRQEVESLKNSGRTEPDAQAAALQSIIARKQLAAAAREMKLDLVPATVLRQRKADEMTLVEALTEQARKSAPPTSREEAQQYVDEHPASFAQRRIFILDQSVIADNSPDLIKALAPLNTREEIEALLNQKQIKFNKTAGTIDALNIDADAAEKLASMPVGAVFVSPDGNNLRVNYVRDIITQPIEGEAAIKVAQDILQARRADEMVATRINDVISAGVDKVKYNPAFAPKPPAKKPPAKK
jgi:EpsD family peptidyl-prolyl cis-trans isomerase